LPINSIGEVAIFIGRTSPFSQFSMGCKWRWQRGREIIWDTKGKTKRGQEISILCCSSF
jgi:hypothetical protein